jgi:16S rRNA processing protein RimM
LEEGAEAYETLAGVIVGAHGVQGTLKVRPATSTAAALFMPTAGAGGSKPRLPVWIGSSPAEGRIYHVVSAKRQEPKGGYLIRLEGVDNRTAALGMAGLNIYTPDTRRAPLGADEYFVEDLIGLHAVTETGRDLGSVTQVIAQPASDVYETDRDVLIPAVKAFIAEIDLAGKRLVVRDVPGLLPAEQDEA